LLENHIDLKLIRRFDAIDAKNGLGEDLFLAVSQLVPSLNVELLIKSDDRKSTLLTWRSDQYYGPGWHVPGGVVRFKERLLDRVHNVAKRELNRELATVSGPVGFHEMFNKNRDVRGHFVSFVFEVTLKDAPDEAKRAVGTLEDGMWRWFDHCPKNLIPNQKQLRIYL
jgi:ADP-ribose pyrophosphatase YjhB (NUDIX family)